MYSVIVVDDDKETLELLGKEIDWQKLNCRLDGMAQTMEEGLFLVEEKHPELISYRRSHRAAQRRSAPDSL